MKDLMKKGMSFATFDTPLEAVHISTQFAETHTRQQEKIQGWSTTSTRQQLIAQYWFRHVAGHFAFLFGLPVLVMFLLYGYKHPVYFLTGTFIAGIFSYSIVYIIHYRHYFSSHFLPLLETTKELYEGVKTDTQSLCKKAQFSTFSLVLIFYVLDKTSNINAIQCNQKFARHLTKIFGRSPKGVNTVLEFLFGKKKDLSLRKTTEVEQDFQEACSFFEEMDFKEGVLLLQQFEQKILKRYQNTTERFSKR